MPVSLISLTSKGHTGGDFEAKSLGLPPLLDACIEYTDPLETNMTKPLVHTTRLAGAYRRYLQSADPCRFAHEVDESYTAATLNALLSRGQVEQRRAAALALGMLGDRCSVDALGRAISDSDRGVRLVADDSFRAVLVRDAAPLHHQQLLRVMHLNDGGEYAAALSPAMILIDQAPCYSEAHHQLAICWHGLEDFSRAQQAYQNCLWHCRFHYLAWQSLAKIRYLNGHLEKSLQALDHCLAINPDLETARMQRRQIRRQLRQSDV
ncbi:Tetratricopeptide repeat protein [Allorhodopirellula heiligendammensis]|uniref:Tetratricopeptide repeat protein n=2 Tax=Allorhodopirellula heiligendammensis TaxID=2714739 RepID=A0A5C6BFI8_9BACT|nr:Tetratricopeptide repeat protein [Allorhodopirellula heiligendammensis]